MLRKKEEEKEDEILISSDLNIFNILIICKAGTFLFINVK